MPEQGVQISPITGESVTHLTNMQNFHLGGEIIDDAVDSVGRKRFFLPGRNVRPRSVHDIAPSVLAKGTRCKIVPSGTWREVNCGDAARISRIVVQVHSPQIQHEATHDDGDQSKPPVD